MKLIFTGHDYRYAVEQSLLAFFPEERPVCEGEDPHTARVALTMDGPAASAVTELSVDGKTSRGTACVDTSGAADEYERERLKQRAVKLSFFEAARALTGVTPAWGALTGIRPGIAGGGEERGGDGRHPAGHLLRFRIPPEAVPPLRQGWPGGQEGAAKK